MFTVDVWIFNEIIFRSHISAALNVLFSIISFISNEEKEQGIYIWIYIMDIVQNTVECMKLQVNLNYLVNIIYLTSQKG